MSDYSPSEMMAAVAARELRDGEVTFVGIGLPNLACNLARATHAPNLVLIYELNDWTYPSANNWAVVPHTKAGWRGGTSGWIQPSAGQSSIQLGADGGNVGLLDGSVNWKVTSAMVDHTNAWSAAGVPAGYIGTW